MSCVCVCVCVCVCMYVCMYTSMHAYIYIDIYVFVFVRTPAYIRVVTYVRICVYVHQYMCLHTFFFLNLQNNNYYIFQNLFLYYLCICRVYHFSFILFVLQENVVKQVVWDFIDCNWWLNEYSCPQTKVKFQVQKLKVCRVLIQLYHSS